MRVWHFTEQSYVPGWEKAKQSIRVDPPSSIFDPDVASDLLNRYLDEYIAADELGLDLMVNEHHTTLSCTSPAVMIHLGILARQTKRARLLTLGIPLANRMDPFRIAEEIALVDTISRGRVEVGMVKGVPVELFSSNANPVRLMDRFWESHDLIMKALTTTSGPFSWEGRYFQYRNVNVYPPVYQRPHPPIWIPSGSPGSAREIAQRGYVLATFMVGYHAKTVFKAYREAYRTAFGREPALDRMAYLGLAVVGASKQEARSRAEKVATYLPTLFLQPPATRNPPGYMSVADNARALVTKAARPLALMPDGSPLSQNATLEDLANSGTLFWGTPDEVYQQIVTFSRGVGGFGHLLMEGQAGTLSHKETLDSLQLFANEVYPRLKEHTATQSKSLDESVA